MGRGPLFGFDAAARSRVLPALRSRAVSANRDERKDDRAKTARCRASRARKEMPLDAGANGQTGN